MHDEVKAASSEQCDMRDRETRAAEAGNAKLLKEQRLQYSSGSNNRCLVPLTLVWVAQNSNPHVDCQECKNAHLEQQYARQCVKHCVVQAEVPPRRRGQHLQRRFA